MTDKHALIQPDKGQPAIAIHLVDKDGLEAFRKSLSAPQRAALGAQKFEADGYQSAIGPDGGAPGIGLDPSACSRGGLHMSSVLTRNI